MVEQILANLVDNAAKYASTLRRPPHPPADLGVRASGWRSRSGTTARACRIRAVRRLFRPFSKSAHDAAHSAPGVGLGLALSRRLARALGGDLRLGHNGPDGVSFVLTLPIIT